MGLPSQLVIVERMNRAVLIANRRYLALPVVGEADLVVAVHGVGIDLFALE